jgi:hypothetical protein
MARLPLLERRAHRRLLIAGLALVASLGLGFGGCGGAQGRREAESVAAPASVEVEIVADAGPSACERYGRAVRGPLASIDAAADGFLDALAKAEGAAVANAARASAQVLDAQAPALAAIAGLAPDLAAANARLVGTLGDVSAALLNYAAAIDARDPAAVKRGGHDLQLALGAWQDAVAQVLVVCPDLE